MSEEQVNLSPLDIRKKQFAKAVRGYEIKEVDMFLELMTAELEGMVRKKDEYRRLIDLKDSEIKEVKERETSMRKTLENLQQILTDERSRAEEKGKHIIRQAEVKASEIIMEAKEEQVSLQHEINQLRRMRREFLAKVGSLVDSYKKIVDQAMQILEDEMRVDSDVQLI
ncbi:MAG: DivIVA domain-containing protein [bacterium]|nr:DivIVA domain-containing protein [bacterium]